jgi:hypothetical protein
VQWSWLITKELSPVQLSANNLLLDLEQDPSAQPRDFLALEYLLATMQSMCQRFFQMEPLRQLLSQQRLKRVEICWSQSHLNSAKLITL